MGVQLKVDEDLPRQLAETLNANGHDALTVLEQGRNGAPDDVLWQHVQAEGRWLITADKALRICVDIRREAMLA